MEFESPDDVVAGVLAYSGLERVTSNKEKLFKTFYQLKQKYPIAFGDIEFIDDEFHYSETLVQIIMGFQTSEIIQRPLLSKEEYIINREYIIKELLKEYKSKEKEFLKQISADFKKLIN